ncbi:MAG TPA: NAD(P)/FAD-dependent oxidoreductase [Chloroflexia bacterium]|nr:NAD(P)/FAD-dependent oxidoreductase [Chloroflexia bacterium]
MLEQKRETETPKIIEDSENKPKTFTELAQRVGGRPRVVIVGAGFGGLNVIQQLAGKDVDILVLDRNNYHGFWPLLYQVATAGLEPQSIAYPVRALVRKYSNIAFQLANVKGIDLEKKQVMTENRPISYDYLVLAAGSANSYFGNDALAKTTYGLKDLEDAIRLRNCVLKTFEQAIQETDPERRKAMLTFVIVGGGPTGVELSGAFAELIRHVLRKDYRNFDLSEARVILVEALDKILAPFPASLQQKAMKRLAKMGVQVMLNKPVAGVEPDRVKFKDGTELLSNTVVWAAGVRGAHLGEKLGVELARGFRVKVEPTLNLPGHPEVFVIGDMAYLEGFHDNPKMAYPMVAPVAIQMGKYAAKNILAQVHGESLEQFKYFDKGSMATIGRQSAVMDAFGIHLSGYFAWLAWLFVHLMSLVGFRNRLIVFTNWAYNYFTYDRAARLITGKNEH